MAIDNTRNYDNKESTNLRIDPELKTKLQAESETSNPKKTMSDIINDMLRKRYSKK